MSDDLKLDPEITTDVDATEAEAEEYEEITSDEVDRVVAMLDAMIETVESDNIRAYLEDAMDGIYYLVYEEEEEDNPMADAA